MHLKTHQMVNFGLLGSISIKNDRFLFFNSMASSSRRILNPSPPIFKIEVVAEKSELGSSTRYQGGAKELIDHQMRIFYYGKELKRIEIQRYYYFPTIEHCKGTPTSCKGTTRNKFDKKEILKEENITNTIKGLLKSTFLTPLLNCSKKMQ